jgi:hypothetical protein
LVVLREGGPTVRAHPHADSSGKGATGKAVRSQTLRRSEAKSARSSGAGNAATGCSQQARALLLLYALSAVEEHEAIEVEAHLVTCEPCFEDLKHLDRTGTLIQEFLSVASPYRERIRASLGRAQRRI